nr:MAG TPA: hypothetical protein [Caudoviricetes sp.]
MQKVPIVYKKRGRLNVKWDFLFFSYRQKHSKKR